MKKKFSIDLSIQNKLIIFALIFSTVLIVSIAFWAVNKVKGELDKSYQNFGQLLVKTLAVQNHEITQSSLDATKLSFIKAHVNSILSSTNDISYITFKNKKGQIIYTTIENYSKRARKTDTNISSPILDSNNRITGVVEVGLSADLAKNVTLTAKNSMFVVFSTIWIVFTLVILANAFLIRRELNLLHQGVKEIEEGKFGTVLDYNQASGEIKELFDAFNDMSKKLHNYEEQNIDQMAVERNKLEAVLMSIANGVVVCDNYDKISMINSAALKILNTNQKELLNSSIQDYCDTRGELCFREKIAVFKNTPLDIIEKKPLEFNIEVDSRVVKAIISPMYSKMHDYLGYIIILIDITKEIEVDRLKNDFISNVSHELRTPVTILSTYVDTLYNFGDNFKFEEQKEFIGTINQEVIRLNRMVNDILDFSRIQSDRKLEKEKQDITSSIEKIIKSHKVLADEKGISLTFIKEDNLPKLPYNSQSIERVLSNLITNAIKYSPFNARVKVRAEIARNPEYLEVTVEDNGVGISPEHQKMIFERFYRIENQVHTVKGTGLGLHLVKVAIEKHHQGKVFVNSKPQEGSTFGFWLPLKEVCENKEIEKNPQAKTIPTIEKIEQKEKKEDFPTVKIEKIEDYSKKAQIDAEFIGTIFNEEPKETKKEDEWEISFEVRD